MARIGKVDIEEIKKKIDNTKSRNLQLEFLEKLISEGLLAKEERKFVYTKISEIYEEKLFYPLAAKFLEKAAEAAIKQKDKEELLVKEGNLLLKAKKYKNSLNCFIEAGKNASNERRKEIKKELIKAFFDEADKAAKIMKFRDISDLLKTIVEAGILEDEKREKAIDRIIDVNAKLGKIMEEKRWKVYKKTLEEKEILKEKERERLKDWRDDLGINKI